MIKLAILIVGFHERKQISGVSTGNTIGAGLGEKEELDGLLGDQLLPRARFLLLPASQMPKSVV